MNRIIKFRAWNDATNKMVHSNHCIEFDGSVHYYKDGCVLRTELILMQYTGLKDKNGTEIYEGDIVTWPDHHSRVGLITQRSIIEWKQSTCRFNLRSLNKHYDNDKVFADTQDYEIIGNVHENPELLTNHL